MSWRFLAPKLLVTGWSTDGLHEPDYERRERLSFVDGWSVAFAWLGLHVEFVIAMERVL